jgi:hypothetical protein
METPDHRRCTEDSDRRLIGRHCLDTRQSLGYYSGGVKEIVAAPDTHRVNGEQGSAQRWSKEKTLKDTRDATRNL